MPIMWSQRYVIYHYWRQGRAIDLLWRSFNANSCFLLKIGQGSDKMTLFLFPRAYIEIEGWKWCGKCSCLVHMDWLTLSKTASFQWTGIMLLVVVELHIVKKKKKRQKNCVQPAKCPFYILHNTYHILTIMWCVLISAPTCFIFGDYF